MVVSSTSLCDLRVEIINIVSCSQDVDGNVDVDVQNMETTGPMRFQLVPATREGEPSCRKVSYQLVAAYMLRGVQEG